MPIMAAHDQNDARGSARVLATTAKRCIDSELAPSRYVGVINNLYRLLEAYRTHRFTGYEYEPRSERGPEALTLMPNADRHVLDLRAALEHALGEVYRDEHPDRAVESIEGVLRSLVLPGSTSDHGDRQRASAFLASFIHNLYGQP